ncbi:methylenetetrahydrofolate reductase (NADPH) [Halalkaliarchaeum desulfuricum]|uniref:Methylenetetrahydrofolate reductase (NADPH) n=1 Tax=Halalkaliarchaeum desulfuricum TaxID=2055893 RepID=A0A343TG94_9EURY|nr:methylenetetrahydrofolate reductase [Halalkaliarchaeum desulfuricum]AUX08116.1 methylenetetrahydrofolate reductase (NADPH) [Halalkaliarchaeum desulfuricum]
MTRDDITALLTDPRFELLPFDSFYDQADQLPEGSKIAVTASPDLGVDRTVEVSLDAVERGFEVTPHIAARGVSDVDHLQDIADQYEEAGISDLFVVGGDNEEPVGEFESAHDALVALAEHGYDFEEVGIGGYPEGHQKIDDDTLAEALEKKSPYATYAVTQLCFDPEAIIEWTDEVQDRGIDLQVHVGIPGVVKYQRLLQISRKVGVGDSIGFLRKTTGIIGFVKQLVGSRGNYTPDRLVEELAPYGADPDYPIEGVHLYTFNQAADTEKWRRELV